MISAIYFFDSVSLMICEFLLVVGSHLSFKKIYMKLTQLLFDKLSVFY